MLRSQTQITSLGIGAAFASVRRKVPTFSPENRGWLEIAGVAAGITYPSVGPSVDNECWEEQGMRYDEGECV